MTPQLLIFDLDDTLVDWSERSLHAKRAVSELLAAETGYSEAEWMTVLREPDGDLWQQVITGDLPHSELEAARMRRLLVARGRDDAELLARACATYRSTMVEHARVDERVLHLLASIRDHHTVYLLTNGLADFQWLTVRRLGLEPYFDQILICSDLGAYKPDHAAFNAVLHHANCAPKDAWMIGDSWADDIVPALGLGMTAVWVNVHRKPFPDGYRPHFDIASVLELAQLLD